LELKNYPIEFVERTIDLIESGFKKAEDSGLEVTFLLNCTLGLLVAAYENLEKSSGGGRERDYLGTKICDLDEEYGFSPNEIAYIDSKVASREYKRIITSKSLLTTQDTNIEIDLKIPLNGYSQARNLKLSALLKKIRNGIAHQNMEPINNKGKWVGVKIWNDNQGMKDFEIQFSIDELKEFSLFLAKRYIETFKPQDNGE